MNTGKRDYKKGTFGYWWTMEQGREDIADVHYRGSINCINKTDITSCEGMPARISGGLDLSGCKNLKNLPPTLRVGGNLDLVGCSSLRELPQKLHVGKSFDCSHCTALRHLPEGMQVGKALIIVGCRSLRRFPKHYRVSGKIRVDSFLFNLPGLCETAGVVPRIKKFFAFYTDVIKQIWNE